MIKVEFDGKNKIFKMEQKHKDVVEMTSEIVTMLHFMYNELLEKEGTAVAKEFKRMFDRSYRDGVILETDEEAYNNINKSLKSLKNNVAELLNRLGEIKGEIKKEAKKFYDEDDDDEDED